VALTWVQGTVRAGRGQENHPARTAADGNGAARIEEEVVVTADGCRVITLFPAQELFIANEY